MRLLWLSTVFLVLSCSDPFGEDGLSMPDLKPPVLLDVILSESRTLSISFDEAVEYVEDSFRSEQELAISRWSHGGDQEMIFHFTEDQVPGKLYKIRAEVCDEAGNSLSFFIRFYGWNPDLPELLINEFNPAGSGNNPDTIELYVKESGNTAGLSLFLGTSRFFTDFLVLPSLQVEKGDYIIVHMRPEGLEEEISETIIKNQSGGKLSSDAAWDIWSDSDKALSGSNGLISLYTNPFGIILDAVPYSNRVSADSEEYRGWTAATYEMIEDLSFLESWSGTNGFIRPEDAVSSEGTTGTRSICRNSLSEDSNSPEDWHIVPTGEKSFGEANSDNVY